MLTKSERLVFPLHGQILSVMWRGALLYSAADALIVPEKYSVGCQNSRHFIFILKRKHIILLLGLKLLLFFFPSLIIKKKVLDYFHGSILCFIFFTSYRLFPFLLWFLLTWHSLSFILPFEKCFWSILGNAMYTHFVLFCFIL